MTDLLDSLEEAMVQLLCDLVSVPAISPESGGRGGREGSLPEPMYQEIGDRASGTF